MVSLLEFNLLPIQEGLCQCGCGQLTTIAKSNTRSGTIKGQHNKFLKGHAPRSNYKPFTEEHKKKIGDALRGKSNTWSTKPKTEKVCPCGRKFLLQPARVKPKRGKFCNRDCYYKYRIVISGNPTGSKRPPFSKEWKNKISETRKRLKIASGSNNPNWRGGITKIQILIRNSSEYKIWRTNIFDRDGFKCTSCGIPGDGKNLNVDHIKPLSIIIREFKIKKQEQIATCNELWDEENGRTLCINCHKQTNTYGWRIWNGEFRAILRNKNEVTI